MAQYLHGAYGSIQTAGSRVSAKSTSAIVYIGTAPVHTVEGGAANVNKPVLVEGIAEAKRLFGYSEDFAKYTLCEAMHVHFELNGVAPLVLINVLDPAVHKKETQETKTLTPVNGRVLIADAEDIVLDTITITGKNKGTDYTAAYDPNKKTVSIVEATKGALGTQPLTIKYDVIDASQVDDTDVIGSTDGAGLNKGIYAIANVYQATGHVPSYILAPGFSGVPAVHNVLVANSKKINGHWDAYLMVDLPLMDDSTALTVNTIKAWKDSNGYTNGNETVYFPMAQGTDGKKYHLSVLAAANFQRLLIEQGDIPYKTASNTDTPIIENLYMGETNIGRVYDDTTINEKLVKNGIASAVYAGGRWCVWGCHSADYDQDNKDMINVSETNRMMLYYISNDFQHRRTRDVDKPLSGNDIESIVAEEQARLDALVKIGALTYGECHLNADAIARSDVYNGDYSFAFNVTTTPLAKSLTAVVNWTDDGFVTYYQEIGE